MNAKPKLTLRNIDVGTFMRRAYVAPSGNLRS